MNGAIRGRIDGREVTVERDTTILQAARGLGLAIPTLCHHPGLPDEGSCRLCLVEIAFGDQTGKLVASCMYPLRDNDFDISTDNGEVRSARAFVLELLISRCPSSPRLLALACAYGVQPEPRFSGPFERSSAENGRRSKPARIEPESGLCLLCGRCSRACEINGTSAISMVGRGRKRVAVGPFYQAPDDCVGCLACASVCPTGAIKAEEASGLRRIWGREFVLIQCQSCGEEFAAREQLHFLSLGGELCPGCRRREMASALNEAQRFSSN